MSKRIRNTNKLKNEIIINRIRIFLIAALMVIIFYPPYLQGLFFEKHILPTQIFVFILFIIFLIYKLLKKDYTFFKTPIEYISLGFVIVYFMAIFVAVHTRSAIIEWLKYCMYFAVFYMISDLADNQKTKLLFLWTIVVSAIGVSIIGLDAAMGGSLVRILNKFFNVLGVKGELFFGLFVDNRIHSTLQYPNALASYLMAVFFVTVGLLMYYTKWWQKIILGAFSFILFLTFMLTQSRGAQLLFPIAVIILLISAPIGNKISIVTHAIALVLPAGVISLFIVSYLSADTINSKVVIFLLVGLLITIFISIIVNFVGKILQKINWKVYITFTLVLIIIVCIAISYVINSTVPVELSLLNSEENKAVSVSRDVMLKPNRDYILRFEAEGKMKEENPYAFFVRISNKNLNNILFGGSKQLIRHDFHSTNGLEIFDLLFTTEEDTKLINIDFTIYYAGTGVIINNAHIIDAITGKTVKNIMLKNKYNLDSVISRFQNIIYQYSLVTRTIYYKDALKIFRDYWFLGAGGGAWSYLYRQYQSYNYASSQAHNYPLQLGIETGIIGLIILIALVITLIINYIKYYRKNNSNIISAYIITAVLVLLLHSVIDFDFAESSMLLLFWSLVALFNRDLKDNMEFYNLKLFNVIRKIKSKKYIANTENKKAAISGIVLSIIILYFSSTFFIALSFANQAFEFLQNNDIEKAINKIEKAIKFDKFNEKYVIGYNPIPSRPDIKAGLIDILFIKNDMYKKAQKSGMTIPETDLYLFENQFSRAASYINNVEKTAENNLSLKSNLASYYFKIGETDKGIDYLNSAISYFPFEPLLWHSKVDVFYQLMAKYFNIGAYEKAEECLLKGLNVINEAMEINRANKNPFVFNQNTLELIQKMKFLKDNCNNAEVNNVSYIAHYSIFDLDIDMDNIPDQWKLSNPELAKLSINEENLLIQTSGWIYIYTPVKLKKGSTYKIELQIKGPNKNVLYYISDITLKPLSLTQANGKYEAEFIVENDPNENGNEFRIYVNDDCVIEKILVREVNSSQ